jgi:SH3-like domain-containing protein
MANKFEEGTKVLNAVGEYVRWHKEITPQGTEVWYLATAKDGERPILIQPTSWYSDTEGVYTIFDDESVWQTSLDDLKSAVKNIRLSRLEYDEAE